MQNLITDHLDIWTAAHKTRSTAGRGSNNKLELVGIKKLRELILELAVRGKLVPQDPNDEPASELLRKIAAEKMQLIKEGKIKKEKPKEDSFYFEMSYEIPANWQWSQLGQIAIINPRNSAEDELEASFVPMTLIDSRFDGGHEQELRLWKEIKQGFTHFAEGDIGVAKITPCFENSKACVFKNLVNKIGAGTTELHIVRPINNSLNPRYVLAFLKSPSFLLVGETKMTGTAGQKRLPKDFLESYPFALPPLAEQHRIVAKVDELMAFCDQLEQTQSDNIAAHAQLVEALLASLTNSSDHFELQNNWQRIAAHFDTLFTTEHSIDQLKQTILQLAVMGKLVPQNPSDEPASELLKKIAAEKAQLIKEGKIKKEKPLPEITDEEKPFELPSGWEWVYLNDLFALVTDGDHQAPPKSDDGVPFLVIGNLNTGDISFEGCRYVPTEYFEKLDWGKKPTTDDVLYTVTGSYGIPIKVKSSANFCVQRHVAIFKSLTVTPVNYILILLGAKFAYEYATKIATGIAQKTVPLTGLRKMPIPLAPLSEQHRIVAKVDELMALCDTLKTNLQNAQTTQLALADALVERAVN